jgi:pimeloyl-ACP methyl ester carboxylesterase
MDMIGFGGSAKSSAEITIRTQAEAVRALLDAEGVTRASLIGNSVGGWVTATFASMYPARTDKLVLVDAAGFKAMFDGPSPVNFYPDTVEEMRKLLSYVLVAPATQTPEFAERALAGLNASGDKQAAAAVFKGLFASPRLEEVMPGIGAPTLVLWGAQDKLFPPVIADLVSGNIRGSKKMLIDSAGHFPQLDNPAAFHKAVAEFLL